MKNKKRTSTVSDTSTLSGVYPEQGPAETAFPLGVYSVFDDDLPRDSMENNTVAANLEGAWPDPRLK